MGKCLIQSIMKREEVIGGRQTEVFQEIELSFRGGDAKNDF